MLRRGSRSGAEVLRSENDKEEAFEAICGLVDRIDLSPEKGKLRVDLHGEIAAILKLAPDSKNPGRDLADRAEQLLMVAGARNHLDLQLQELLATIVPT